MSGYDNLGTKVLAKPILYLYLIEVKRQAFNMSIGKKMLCLETIILK